MSSEFDEPLQKPAQPIVGEAVDPGPNAGNAEPNQPPLSRLHPTSLVFDIISHGRSYLIPAVIAMFSAAKGNAGGVIFAGFIFIPALLVSIFRFFTFRFSIQNRQLIVTKGLIFRSVRTVPVSRIQNIDYVQNVLHRLLNVAEVRVETASGTEPEAILRVLSIDQMERLRREIFDLQSDAQSVTDGKDLAFGVQRSDTSTESKPEIVGQTLLEIPTRWLVRAGLASNRGLLMVGILIGAYYQFDLEQYFDIWQFRKFVPQDANQPVVILGAVLGVLAILLILRLLGIGWFLLRFHSYRLVRYGEDLRISCGLLTKVSATVPRSRIQFISIHRNLIMRWMGYASVRIETAGGAGKENENATTTVSRRWFVPIIPIASVPGLLAELRPGLDWNEEQLDFQPLSPHAGRRLLRLAIVGSLVVAGGGLAFTRPWGWLAGLVVLPLFSWLAIRKSRSMKYARTEDGVVYRSGVLYRKTSLTFLEKIQTLRLDQSPFDRRWKMASLTVDTAAAGPAEHRIDVPYLDETFARRELQALRIRTASRQPNFG